MDFFKSFFLKHGTYYDPIRNVVSSSVNDLASNSNRSDGYSNNCKQKSTNGPDGSDGSDGSDEGRDNKKPSNNNLVRDRIQPTLTQIVIILRFIYQRIMEIRARRVPSSQDPSYDHRGERALTQSYGRPFTTSSRNTSVTLTLMVR